MINAEVVEAFGESLSAVPGMHMAAVWSRMMVSKLSSFGDSMWSKEACQGVTLTGDGIEEVNLDCQLD